MPSNYLLTKSKYIRGLQCEKALFYDVYSPKLAHYDKETLEKFRHGRNYEGEYKAKFPQGIAIDNIEGRNVSRYPQLTAQLLQKEGAVVLFEAGFLFDEVLVLADVVIKHSDGIIEVHEVKSGAHLTDTYVRDAAIQHFVIRRALADLGGLYGVTGNNLRIGQFCVVHNDSNGDSFNFIIDKVIDECIAMQPTIEKNIGYFKQMLRRKIEPTIAMGDQCNNPYSCPYKEHCSKANW